jgi:hypothetical protein
MLNASENMSGGIQPHEILRSVPRTHVAFTGGKVMHAIVHLSTAVISHTTQYARSFRPYAPYSQMASDD